VTSSWSFIHQLEYQIFISWVKLYKGCCHKMAKTCVPAPISNQTH